MRIDGGLVGRLELTPATGWIEPSIDLPAGLPDEVELALTPVDGEWLDCHVWILEDEGAAAAAR